MSYQDEKSFLEELQSLSEGKKKQVLIIGTTIIMILVVGVWASYFNGIIAASSQSSASGDTADASNPNGSVAINPSTDVSQPADTVAANGPSMWQNIVNGMASIANMFKQPSQYKIQPK